MANHDIISSGTHRWIPNSMIHHKLGHAIVWIRTRRPRRVRGYQHRWNLIPGASPAASLHGGRRRSRLHQARNDSKHKERFQEMHKLTRCVMRWLMRSIAVGYELEVNKSMNSGVKGIGQRRWLEAPRPDSFHTGATGRTADLPGYTFDLQMTSTNGTQVRRS
jgi:hypothetical protein